MRRLEVWIDFGATGATRRVGTLAEDRVDHVFEYAAEFLADPLPISPYLLPARPGLTRHREREFDRLPGVIADAVPDGFGRLVQDRAFEARGLARAQVRPLDRLAALGGTAMGALTFRPADPLDRGARSADCPLDLDELAAQGERLLEGSSEDVLPQLVTAGGSPGGARPKVLAGVHEDGRVIAGIAPDAAAGETTILPTGFRPYLIKFAAREDVALYGRDVGAVEFAYWTMARDAGIAIPPARLFPAGDGRRWFGVERFDRAGPEGRLRRHMHTIAGLLHADYRTASLEYEQVLETSADLTKDVREVMEAFRRMAFNVFAHNRDDHAKNISFLMTHEGTWSLSPAYDLTFSAGMAGHHTTAVGGETRAPRAAALLRLAEDAGVDTRRAAEAMQQVVDAIGTWPSVARGLDVEEAIIARLEKSFTAVRTAATMPSRRHGF